MTTRTVCQLTESLAHVSLMVGGGRLGIRSDSPEGNFCITYMSNRELKGT